MASPTFGGWQDHFMWNLSGNVGRNSPNLLDDVELVRYGYFCFAQNPKMKHPELLAPLARMSSYGAYGPDLQEVIDLHESLRGGTQDGHVSVVPPGGFAGLVRGQYDEKHVFVLVALNNNMKDRDPNRWPRIDLAAESGPEITRYVKGVFTVV